ncbi:HIT family protein [Corynebacterium heidelbergense]|uniref:Diadenosine tetraphosphate hydrolase n=1 Tax=Corynebacterium heidelbergense TaxID=2055947 RepID=A0A364VD84_9CORY|nr:HIT domain-containing protein [Corynebacterium heidelbergense]RAV34590.1 diadenosine tetraphosphate hydrolase [Corynebacterium heidelbergense]WCZ36641.1 AP-4-A phosphorylase [Corynebacterium heidelbergense]
MSTETGADAQAQEPYRDSGVGDTPKLPDGLLRLWAPYRSAYLTTESRSEDPFLDIPQMSDEDGLVVARGETVYCVLNLFPYNPGHMMVVPYRQVADYADLTWAETQELARFTQHALRVLREVSHPDAVNVGMNLGRASGGSVPTHLHQHIVPRWAGDSSFMTVIAGTKVLPQVLGETRELLAKAWRKLQDADGPGVHKTENQQRGDGDI